MKLAQYIQQVDEKVNQELEKDLKDNIALGRKNLQDSLRTQEVVTQEQKICVSVRFRKRCSMRIRRR